jgi:colicin import membrane protein
MENRKETARAVVLAALLHILIVGSLALGILPCTTYEQLFEMVDLPAAWNPMSCPKPLELPGQIIEATLVGPTGSPPPRAIKAKPVPDPTPPPPASDTPPPPTPEKPVIKTLPPVVKQPDVKDQEKVVDDAPQKAEDAKKIQEEKQRQHQAEIDAQAEQKKKVDEIFKQLDLAKAQSQKEQNKTKQAKQQLADLQASKDDGKPDLPKADQLQSGTNGPDTGLLGQYLAAVQNAVTSNWLRPDNMPNASCVVHIVQLPGGQVMSAKVDSSCSYDDAGKRSIENAVLRAQPLPYQGFEKVFQRNLDFTFRPQ